MTVLFWPPRQHDDYERWYPPAWTDQALCAEIDPELFFPEKGERADPARQVCASCPVRSPCLEYALGRDDYGVWGGYTQRERREFGKQAA